MVSSTGKRAKKQLQKTKQQTLLMTLSKNRKDVDSVILNAPLTKVKPGSPKAEREQHPWAPPMPCAVLTLVTLVLHCHPDGLIFLRQPSQPYLLLSLAHVVWWFRLINAGTHPVRINRPFEVLTPQLLCKQE